MVLKENIDKNFDILKKQTVKNLDELLRLLSSKKKLQDFSKQHNIDENYLTILVREIKSYRQKPSNIKDFPELSDEIILKLAKLTDLSRIRWVNHTFAYVLLEANYDATEKVANADYKELYETVKQLNEDRKIYKGHIGLHDMKLCVEAAKDVSLEVEY